jgi:hypothetical protein
MPDMVTALINQVVFRRTMIFVEWMEGHHGCQWPGPHFIYGSDRPLTQLVQCTCGDELEVTLVVTPVVRSRQPKSAAQNWR